MGDFQEHLRVYVNQFMRSVQFAWDISSVTVRLFFEFNSNVSIHRQSDKMQSSSRKKENSNRSSKTERTPTQSVTIPCFAVATVAGVLRAISAEARSQRLWRLLPGDLRVGGADQLSPGLVRLQAYCMVYTITINQQNNIVREE